MKLSSVFFTFVGLMATYAMAWHYCAFLNATTVALAVASYTILVLVAGIALSDLIDEHSVIALGVALITSAAILGLPILSEYNANKDIIQTIKAIGNGPVYINENVAQRNLKVYPDGDPATRFLDKFLLTTKHPTTLVWNNVVDRANYLSYLYTHKYLKSGSTVPHFGFIHANQDLSEDTIHRYNLSATEYSGKRQQGKTVRYIDSIIAKVQDVVYGRNTFYNNYANRLADINSVHGHPATSLAAMRIITKISKNSSTSALSNALNATLGATVR